MLAKVADTNGQPWHDVFQNALAKYTRARGEEEVDLAAEYRDLLPGLEPGQPPVSLERIRQILSNTNSLSREDITHAAVHPSTSLTLRSGRTETLTNTQQTRSC
jgi:hypothetical protein